MGELAANLSGVTIGTIIKVIGLLKDNRFDQERKRADAAEAKIAEAQAKTAVADADLQQERERADRERELAEHYLSELERFRERYEKTTEVFIQLLRERDGNHPPSPGSTG